jgi:glucoamylase
MRLAPNGPGISPRWTSSDKVGVGTALSPLSRVWFTLSHGILNEIYYPRVDQACTRDFGFLVTDGVGFFSEEKRDAHHRIVRPEDGVPAFRLTNRCVQGRYTIEKQVISDPRREVVLQCVRLVPSGDTPLRLFALLAPHLVNGGANNTGWVGDYKGVDMLFAEGGGTALALAASVPWRARSVGFVGVNDGWLDVSRHFALTDCYDRAVNGNVALTGELDLRPFGSASVILALGFGRTPSEAAYRVKASLAQGFDAAYAEYAAAWRDWQRPLLPLDRHANGHNSYRTSTTALRAHDSPSFPGGIIASLSIPWGASKGDDDLGGYHLVWPRDLAETGGGLIACGAHDDARRVIDYLRAIQDADGSWPQNSWLDGVPYWYGLQMDECAFPILLVDLAYRNGVLNDADLEGYRDMIRRAVAFVLSHGPATAQDRWEEDAGYSTFTLAVEISALLAAADMADMWGDTAGAALLRDTADAWNAGIEGWTYATGTPLAAQAGVEGYYVRIAPSDGVYGRIAIKNRRAYETWVRAADVVSPDALALVRFGLRAADDPRILNTVRVIDQFLKVDFPAGPCWRRYVGDGYGEHEDGSPFDGTGIGRAWPLLTGERAHYALAAGDIAQAQSLLKTMESLTSRGGIIPEQVWDSDDIPARELIRGQPSGSAMPLVWAHAEHVKLCRSLADGAVFDTPPQPVRRYLVAKVQPRCAIWRQDQPITTIVAGRVLRIDLPQAATLHWSSDNWASTSDTALRDTGWSVYVAEVATAGLPAGSRILFTWRYQASGAWAGTDYVVEVVSSA